MKSLCGEEAALGTDSNPFNLVIIGAGPHSLALVLRFLEDSQYNGLTSNEWERSKFWKEKNNNCSCRSLQGNLKLNELRIAVIDKNGEWLCQWNHQFESIKIPYLRSTAQMHIDPFDKDGMREFAFRHARNEELIDQGIFDKISSKRKNNKNKTKNGHNFYQYKRLFNEQEREYFRVPTTNLFHDYCEELIERYGVQNTVIQASVDKIEMDSSSNEGKIVKLTCSASREQVPYTIFTKNVVYAGGPLITPNIPNQFRDMKIPVVHSYDILTRKVESDDSICNRFENLRNKRVTVVGGGLTSAHLCKVLAEKGVEHIDFITKSEIRIQAFDIDNAWISRTGASQQAHFLQAQLEDRSNICKQARRGGSITDPMMQELKIIEKQGKLRFHVGCEVEKELNLADGQNVLHLSDGENISSDMIFLCTGTTLDIQRNPLLMQIQQQCPIKLSPNGLPHLSPDLRWSADCPVYVMGAYASLVLGPFALNLMGAVQGSAKISSALNEILQSEEDLHNQDEEAAMWQKYSLGNRFEFLVAE